MYKKIFFDANIILDIFDNTREQHENSAETYLHILEQKIKLFTSCDIITTLYYVYSKKDKGIALEKIEKLNQTLDVIAFSNSEIEKTCFLMREDKDYKDLEDTMQYILAKKVNSDLIISNDKKFVGKDIKLISSEEFCELVLDKPRNKTKGSAS